MEPEPDQYNIPPALAGSVTCPDCGVLIAYLNADRVPDDLRARLATEGKWHLVADETEPEGPRRLVLEAVRGADDRGQGVRMVVAQIGEKFHCPDCAHEFYGVDASPN